MPHHHTRRAPIKCHMPRTLAILALLTAVTLAVYGRAFTFDQFIAYDTPGYIVENPHVPHGLTWPGVQWAFTTGHLGYWHPVSYVTHMVDVSLFGVDQPRWHHAMNVLWHLAVVLVLFAVLHSMTGAAWRSAIVAMLFAVHPLHVESVAWIAERKDMVSTFFALCAIWAYVRYTRSRTLRDYLLTLGMIALGLMSKPTVVTLPAVLLLLDIWPLQRLHLPLPLGEGRGEGGSKRSKAANAANAGRATETDASGEHERPDAPPFSRDAQRSAPPVTVLRALLEKLPMFALSAISVVITIYGQVTANTLASAGAVTLPERLANAVVSYAWYVGKCVYPSDLALLYPHPYLPGGTPWTMWQIVAAAALLVAITAAAIIMHRRRYLLVGWLWFLGTLVPMIGLVQVGAQGRADRYTYISLTGLLIMLVWGTADLLARRNVPRIITAAAAGGVVIALSVATWVQLGYWRGSIPLFERTLAVYPSNPMMLHHLGYVLREAGRDDEAMQRFRQALAIDPAVAEAHFDLGSMLAQRGDFAGAIPHLRAAANLQPQRPEAHERLCVAWLSLSQQRAARGDIPAAIHAAREALTVAEASGQHDLAARIRAGIAMLQQP